MSPCGTSCRFTVVPLTGVLELALEDPNEADWKRDHGEKRWSWRPRLIGTGAVLRRARRGRRLGVRPLFDDRRPESLVDSPLDRRAAVVGLVDRDSCHHREKARTYCDVRFI
jgi:hypothetical protein